MTRTLFYLTHTRIDFEPQVPVPKWRLSDEGRARLNAMDWHQALPNLEVIFSSAQTRALETAAPIAATLGVPVRVDWDMREADRGSLGYVKDGSFADIINAFFADPNSSSQGLERAVDAQRRVVAAAESAVSEVDSGDLLLVGHGTVGALLYCHYAGVPIDGRYRQTEDGGNFFAVDLESQSVLHDWRPLEFWSSN